MFIKYLFKLFKLLRPNLFKMILKEDYKTDLSYAERIKALELNPVLAARAFKSRIENIIKYIWMGKSEPLGQVIDYWLRIELQNRGSLHAHIIAWCLIYYLGSQLNGDQLTSLVTGDFSFINDPNCLLSEELTKVINEIQASDDNQNHIVSEDSNSVNLSKDKDCYLNEVDSNSVQNNEMKPFPNSLLCQPCNSSNIPMLKDNNLDQMQPNFDIKKETLRKCRSLVSDIVSDYVKAILPKTQLEEEIDENGDENIDPISPDSMFHGSLYDFEFEEVDVSLDENLRNLLLSVQLHDKNHRKTCFKKGNYCRFYYPRPLTEKTEIKFVKLKGLLLLIIISYRFLIMSLY